MLLGFVQGMFSAQPRSLKIKSNIEYKRKSEEKQNNMKNQIFQKIYIEHCSFMNWNMYLSVFEASKKLFFQFKQECCNVTFQL